MFKKLLTTLTVGSAVGLALHAQADSVSYNSSISPALTDWINTVSLQQFNPSLGTLDSIEISLSSGMSTVLTVQNGDATSSSTGSAQTELQISLNTGSIGGYDLFGAGAAPVLDFLSPGFGYNNLPAGQGLTSGTLTKNSSTDTGVLTDGTLLNYFLGIGTVNLPVSTFTQTLLANNGGNTTASQITSAGLNATITYDYTASPVPEPSPLIMLGAGLMGLVFVGRLRTAK